MIINISRPTGGMGIDRARIHWFDETSTIEADNINTGDFYPSILGDYNDTMFLESGTYYIKVSMRDSNRGTYNITATFTPNCKNDSGFDMVKITNTSNTTVSTKGLYLSDDEDNLFKWQMPSIIMKTGQSISIASSNNNGSAPVLKRSQTHFDFSESEVLRLTSADGRALRCWSSNGECVCDTA